MAKHTPPVLPAKALGAAGILYGLDPLDIDIANALRIDATGALVVTTSGGAVPTSAIQMSASSYYTATVPGTGYSPGDVLKVTELLDASGTIISSYWTNMTTGSAISAPPATDIAFQPNTGLTNLELRAAPLDVRDQPALTELQTLNTRINTLLGNTDQVEALQTQTNSLLTTLNSYNDQVESLLTNMTTNVDGLEPLINLLNTYNDQVEPLLTQLSAQFPTTLGAKPSTGSLSVVIAPDQVMNLPTGAATEAKQDVQIAQLTDLNNSVATEATLAALELKAATEVTLAALEAKAATESSLVNLITHFPPGIGPYPSSQSLSVFVSNAADIGGGATGGVPGGSSVTNTFIAAAADTTNSPAEWAAGDSLQLIQIVDTTTTPATIVSETWMNATTGEVIDGVPPTPAQTVLSNSALTDAELRAAPVEVFVVNQPSPAGSVTDQVAYTETLTALAPDAASPSQWSTGDTITYNSVYDNSVNPPSLVSETWFNETTSQVITNPVPPADVAIAPTNGLTDAELRASAIHVIVDNQLAPTAPVTTNTQYIETYTTTASGAGYTAGDVLTRDVVMDESVSPPAVVSETWFNETTNTYLTTPPAPADIAYAATGGLTNAELRAAPVDVYVVNQIAPGGSITNNTSYSETVTALNTDGTAPIEWTAGDTITYNAVYDESVDPPVLISETWFNETTGLPITNPPTATDTFAKASGSPLTNAELRAAPVEVTTDGLTDAELRATPVDVYVVNQVSPAGSVTDQVSYSETLVATSSDMVSPSEWTVGDTITYNAVYNEAVDPPVLVSETWFNETTGLPINGTPPAATEVAVLPVGGLTNAELRAAPVEVTDALVLAELLKKGERDSLDALSVYVVNQGEVDSPVVAATQNTMFIDSYTAVADDALHNPAEFLEGETLQNVIIADMSGATPVVISNVWTNVSTGAVLTAAPTALSIVKVPSNPLTNAELRAESVHVTVDNFPASTPVPAPTGLQFFSDSFIATAADATVPLEFSQGDYLSREVVYDSATATTVSTTWKNLSTGLTMAQAPDGASIAQTSAAGLTNDELRSAPVEVFVVNQNAPVPSATAVQLFSDNFIATADDATAPFEYVAGDYLAREVKFDTTTGTITSTVWKNLSSGATLTQVPSGTTIAQAPANGLTDAELRASAVHVIVDNPQPTVPPVTSYTTESFTYSALADDAIAPLEYVEGDILQNVQTIDSTVSPVNVLSSVWTNLTTGLVMTQVPSATAISLQPTSGLTNAELRATPVEVFVVNQNTPTTYTPQQVVSELYLAIAAGTGYAVDDVIRRTVVMDTSVTPPTQSSETWVNVTTGATIAAPVATHIALTPTSDSLTDTQLRAAPVIVDVVAKPAVTRTVSIDRISNAIITAAAGSKELSFAVEAGFALIQGAYMPAGYSVTFTAYSDGEVLGAVTVDATNGTVLVTVIE